MKPNRIFAAIVAAMLSATAAAETTTEEATTESQSDKLNMENGVIPIADDRGFTLQSQDGSFVFKPYLFMQTTANFRYYDDEGLDKAYNQDNIANSGFAMPYAIIGFTGKAFGKIDYNLCVNAAASGGNVLQQAWIDYAVSPEVRFRAGKFKTPFTHAYLTTLGETLFPSLPTSLTAVAILPYSLNAVTPHIGTGFDLGVEAHGMFKEKWGYQIGLFNGTGVSVNSATKTFSDDWHIPSLLYAGRITYQPKGVMPATQGNPNQLHLDKMLIGVSASMNVESENESTNDLRLGAEFSWLKNRWYVAAEVYYMHVGFTKRQKIHDTINYMGGYAQVGYFFTGRLQGAFRYDLMERNGLEKDGMLNMPAVGINYFFKGSNLKLQAMYRFTGRTGYATQLDRDNDNLGLAMHTATVQIQYTF